MHGASCGTVSTARRFPAMLEHGMGPGYRSGAVLTEAAELDGGESALGNAIIRAVVRGVLEKSATALE